MFKNAATVKVTTVAVLAGVVITMLWLILANAVDANQRLPKPTNLEASVHDDGVHLTWNGSSGNVDGYRITRYRPELGEKRQIQVRNTGNTDTSWIDQNVEDGVLYRYRVKAIAGSGAKNSKLSNTASARWVAPAPDAPVDLSGESNDEGVTLSWTAPEGDDVTGYRIIRGRPQEGDAMSSYVDDTASTSTTWTDTDVEDQVQYKYQVKAINGSSVGPASNNVTVTWEEPEQPDPPSAPTHMVAWSDSDGVTVRWSRSDSRMSHYQILRRLSTETHMRGLKST